MWIRLVGNRAGWRYFRKEATPAQQRKRSIHLTRNRKEQLKEVEKNEFQRQPAPHLPGQPGQPGPNDPPVPVGKNYLVGGVIVSFVLGVYSYTMYQMKKQNEMDFLDDIDAQVQGDKK